ncbi:addiction module protein [candidate division KSB1 bacterium]|nr:addiction module protein [candidate division KSB1 bacterium]
MTKSEKILKEALDLSPIERAELIEYLLSSFEFPARKEIDRLWAAEAEERIDAYEQGKIKSIPVKQVFEKLDRK